MLTLDAVVHKTVSLLTVVHETHKITNVLDLADSPLVLIMVTWVPYWEPELVTNNKTELVVAR